MTECTDNEQKVCSHVDEHQEKLAETTAEEALKKAETLLKENAELRERLKTLERVFRKYSHLDGYIEKYGLHTDFERDMWQAIRQAVKDMT